MPNPNVGQDFQRVAAEMRDMLVGIGHVGALGRQIPAPGVADLFVPGTRAGIQCGERPRRRVRWNVSREAK